MRSKFNSIRVMLLILMTLMMTVAVFVISGVNYYALNHMKDLERLELLCLGVSLCLIIVFDIIMGIVLKRILGPITSLTDKMINITDGDFTVEVEKEGRGEIAVMSETLKDYVEIMHEVIYDIKEISIQLEDRADATKEISETLNATASDQSFSMGSIQQTMTQMADSVTELAEDATKLANAVDNTSSHGLSASEKMNTTYELTNHGIESMHRVRDNMADIVHSVRNLSRTAETVGEAAKSIEGIVNIIRKISNKTNLLSLNASIEAARAGESGKGFAVVADEIGDLAGNSANSTEQITNITQDIILNIEDLVQKTRDSAALIETNAVVVEEACEAFDSIYSGIGDTRNLVTFIMDEIQKVDDVATNMAAISEQQAASAQEVLVMVDRLTEESMVMAGQSTEVEECAMVVSEASFALNEHMRKFQI